MKYILHFIIISISHPVHVTYVVSTANKLILTTIHFIQLI